MNYDEINDLFIYFLTSIFLEIFKENPIAIKWTKAPNITPKNKSSRRTHIRTKVESDGIVTIRAIIVPFNTISRIEILDDSSSVNDAILKNGNKNQRLAIENIDWNFLCYFLNLDFTKTILFPDVIIKHVIV